ncbi:ATP-binding protein [Candidatus Chloroploca sp. M-50]|uniref:ATP-binding protein n=1 Tax=Candidatus Chloroploca mongolica TaxID=2528176 RepID=A0ABS4DAK3_9CHLR|nr:ATP-binding protein [Candidatus Chloroploca mongolica]MBP1466458.1 ATP-binding protein [Candidatus Chloroploca mongolica]
MMIEFNVKNFRSFRDEQRFSLVASTADKSLAENVGTSPKFKHRLLRSAVVYGPNASGKSNLIMALGFLQLLILRAAQSSPTPGLRLIDHPLLKPFALEVASSTAPTRFELHMLHEGVRYQYGITLDRRAIYEEWLIAYPKGQPQVWFDRQWHTGVDKNRLQVDMIREQASGFADNAVEHTGQGDAKFYTWYFGPRLTGEKQRLTDLSRIDVPFLSTGATFGNQQLRHVFDWFARGLSVLNPWGRPDLAGETARQTLDNSELRSRIRDLLAHADFGIEDFRVQEIPIKEDPLFGSVPEQLLSAIDGLDIRRVDIRMRHRALQLPEGSIEFDRDDESLGTLRFFGIVGPVVDALTRGATLCIDEFDDSLHPLLVRHLIGLFHTSTTNPHNAQLVMNTHDATLLDTQLFRRDQIWLTEKQIDGATSLTPLTDYRPRKEESLMRGYLQGRYGGVPILDQMVKSSEAKQ